MPLLVGLVRSELPAGAPAKAFAAETLHVLAMNPETRRVVLRRLTLILGNLTLTLTAKLPCIATRESRGQPPPLRGLVEPPRNPGKLAWGSGDVSTQQGTAQI